MPSHFDKDMRQGRALAALATVAALLYVCDPTVAQTSQYGDYYYQTTSNGITITDYTGTNESLSIPSQILGVDVTGIASWAFTDAVTLTNVTFPYTVSYIGSLPFIGCVNLRSINVDPLNPTFASTDGVLFDKERTIIINCPEGRGGNYTIPRSVFVINGGAFHSCANLTSITVPEGVTATGDSTFYGCIGLTNIQLPNSLVTIQHNAFLSCYGLSDVTIPTNVTVIGGSAFAYCFGLTNISLSLKLNTIDSNAFYCCYSMSNIAIPNSVTNIANFAFIGSGLRTVTIPESVQGIGYMAFAYCSSLGPVCFLGNAPAMYYSFYLSDRAAFYCLPGTTGWEATGLPIITGIPPVAIQRGGSRLVLSWPLGTLLETTNVVTGPWVTNSAARSPYATDPVQPLKYYRAKFN